MAKFKLITKLPRNFRDIKGLTAIAINQDGEELDSLDITKRRLNFKLKKDDILQGQKKAKLTIKIVDKNGDEVNFSKSGKTYDLDSDEQEFTTTVSLKKKRARRSIQLKGTEIIPPDTLSPVFEEGMPETMKENSGAGALVFRAAASDDSGQAITYSLSGNDASAFSINPETGVVTINENANYATRNKYNFNVVATDSSGNSATKPLILDIADATSPVFEEVTPEPLEEKSGAGVIIVQAAASDNSGDAVTYSLSGTNASAFNINPETGVVTINENANYATRNKYNFNVVATDPSGNSATKSLILDITDITPPVFEEGTPEPLEENAGANAIVFRAAASDNSGEAINYSLTGPEASSFSVNPNTGTITINENADFETKNRYNFNVVATDLSNNSATKELTLNITDTKDTGDAIDLSNQRDFYDENTGKVFDANNNLLTESSKRLSSFNDILKSGSGQFGQGDSLQDPSQDDNDILTIQTDLTNTAEAALDPNNNNSVKNIETLAIEASVDNSNTWSLAGFENLKTLTVTGIFENDISITNYLDTAKVSNFNFSGSRNPDIGFILDFQNNNEPFFANPLNIKGSPGPDIFTAFSESINVEAGDGPDVIVGAGFAPDYIAGEGGLDQIDIFDENKIQDIVSLKGITSATEADTITGFTGFNNAANTNFNRHDLLEFDSQTFTNFTANTKVEQVDADDLFIALLAGEENITKNKFLVDTENNISENFAILEGKDLLALATDTGNIFYSRNGNFDENGTIIGTIDDAANFVANENVVIV